MSETISTPASVETEVLKPETPAETKVVKAVVQAPKPVITPMAHRLTVRPRESAKQAIVDLVPDGNPNPVLLAIAKDAVQKMIDLHPAEYQGMEVVTEIGGGLAHQINIIVIPHKW